MIRRPPRSTRTDTLFPYTTLFRSLARQRCVDLAERLQREINVLPAHADTRVGNLDTNAVPIASDSDGHFRSEEHTSELQSLMRISYAVFCLKKKKNNNKKTQKNIALMKYTNNRIQHEIVIES